MNDILKVQFQRFSELLKLAYNKYAGSEIGKGHPIPSQADFAKWLGVSQTSLSNWINELRPPNQENIDLVATKLGPTVYDIFDLPARMPKDKKAKRVMERWYKLTAAQQAHLEELSANYEEDNETASKANGGDIKLQATE